MKYDPVCVVAELEFRMIDIDINHSKHNILYQVQTEDNCHRKFAANIQYTF